MGHGAPQEREGLGMQEYYFSTRKLSVGYEGRPLIKDIDISVKKGEILTLIGPNGAGKSTILKSIAGQLQLLGGAVYLDEKSLAGMRREEVAKEMSVVFTHKLKTELMTCEDVVATGRYPYTRRFGVLSGGDWKVVREAMELVHVSELAGEDFHKISDGQKQRVMLARAICQEPEILILDEPTSYLDIKYKLEFLSLLLKLRKQKGITVIMSLHELELAAKVSDRILCVKGEYIDKFGTPGEIFHADYISSLFDISKAFLLKEGFMGIIENICSRPEGKKAILLVSFGTTHEDAREKSLNQIYHKLEQLLKTVPVYQAYTSSMVIMGLAKKGIQVNNIIQAAEMALEDHVECLYVVPTHMIPGIEYQKLTNTLAAYQERFRELKIASPVLNRQEDCPKMVCLLKEILQFSPEHEYILMGHGSEDAANIRYAQMNEAFLQEGLSNVRIASVEAKPDLEDAIEDLKKSGSRKKVILHPFMIVAGDHARNDMAGEEDSFASRLLQEGFEVECIVKGLGEYDGFREIFVNKCMEFL